MKGTSGLAALAALFASTANGSVIKYCPSNSNSVCFSVGIPTSSASSNSGNIYFQVTAPTTYAWVALGTGSQMSGSNMFVIYQDGKGNLTLSPRAGTQHTMPSLDTSSTAAKLTLLASSGVSSDGKTLTANVACSNCETWKNGGSLTLTNSASNWIGGWNTGSSLATTNTNANIAQHDDVTTFKLDLTKATITSDSNPFTTTSASTNGTSTGSGSGSGSGSGNSSSSDGVSVAAAPSKQVLVAHGVIMAVVMVLLYPLGSLLMPLLGNWKAHGAWQMVGFVLMWIGLGLGVQAAKERNELFKQTHTMFGTAVVCLMAIQPALGYMHHLNYVKTGGRAAVSWVHIFYGRILMALGIINGGLGLQLSIASNSLVVAYSVVAAVVFFAYMVGAVVSAIRRARQPSPAQSKDIQLQASPQNYSPKGPEPQGGSHSAGAEMRERYV